MINLQKKSAYEFIEKTENTEEFINSKLVSTTKYGSYVIVLSFIFFAAFLMLKLKKYNKKIINCIDKKYKNITTKISLILAVNNLFDEGIKLISLVTLFFTIDIKAFKKGELKINPTIKLLTKIILEKIFIHFNQKEEYNDFEEKEENTKKQTLTLKEQKI